MTVKQFFIPGKTFVLMALMWLAISTAIDVIRYFQGVVFQWHTYIIVDAMMMFILYLGFILFQTITLVMEKK